MGTDINDKLNNDPDFFDSKRFDYSIRNALERYPDGVPNKLIAQGLCVSEAKLEELYQSAIVKLRKILKVR